MDRDFGPLLLLGDLLPDGGKPLLGVLGPVLALQRLERSHDLLRLRSVPFSHFLLRGGDEVGHVLGVGLRQVIEAVGGVGRRVRWRVAT